MPKTAEQKVEKYQMLLKPIFESKCARKTEIEAILKSIEEKMLEVKSPLEAELQALNEEIDSAVRDEVFELPTVEQADNADDLPIEN